MIFIEEFVKANYYGLDYLVGNCGTIIGPKRDVIKQRINQDGYAEVTLGTMKNRHQGIKVHRIVAEQFVVNPDPENKLEVNHIDYNRLNNNADNLEWVTHQENVAHSAKAGHYDNQKGESNGRAKTTYEEVAKMRKEYENGVPVYKIAKEFNKPWSTVGNIVHNKTWVN